MKNLFIILLILLTTNMPVSATTLKGSVEYTVDIARSIAFEDVKQNISMSDFNNELNDFLHSLNIHYLEKHQLKIDSGYNRRLLPFYNKRGKLLAYGVCYDKKPDNIFYYNRYGNLIKIELNPTPNTYPRKSYDYNMKGELTAVNFYVNLGESYSFDKNGKLIVHWFGNTAYNEYGKELKLVRRL